MSQTTAVVDKTNELTAVKTKVETKAKELWEAILQSDSLENFSDDPKLNEAIRAFLHAYLF